MHARIEQLLSIRDGEPVDALLRTHVADCEQCAAELRHLATRTQALRSLPTFAAPAVWPAIRASASQPRAHGSRRAWLGGAAAAAIAVLGVLFAVADRQQPSSGEQDSMIAVDPHVMSLQERSRVLEDTLQSLPRPALVRAGTAATIDGLEQRIRWVDHHLSGAPESELDGEQTAQLWQERVALLDTLVKVRYAESGTYVF